MAIITFLLKMKVRKPVVVYMLNLAAADVLFASVLPFKIVYHFSGNNWVFGSGMCCFVTAAFYGTTYCSILLIASISVDRFLGVVFPMRALSWHTLRRSLLVCLAIWVISIASTIPLLFTEQTRFISLLNITTCHDVMHLNILQTFYVYYFSTICLLFFFFPFIFTAISYFGIIWSLGSSNLCGTSFKRRYAVFLSIVVFCIFIICFGPTNVIFITHSMSFSSETNDSLYFAYILCACVSSISCCLDPLVYYYVSPECRSYVYALLCRRTIDKLEITKALLGNIAPS
ncbi:proteinase-activated receptor 1 [Pelodytes ibericus]